MRSGASTHPAWDRASGTRAPTHIRPRPTRRERTKGRTRRSRRTASVLSSMNLRYRVSIHESPKVARREGAALRANGRMWGLDTRRDSAYRGESDRSRGSADSDGPLPPEHEAAEMSEHGLARLGHRGIDRGSRGSPRQERARPNASA